MASKARQHAGLRAWWATLDPAVQSPLIAVAVTAVMLGGTVSVVEVLLHAMAGR